jgi:hypothetical protein
MPPTALKLMRQVENPSWRIAMDLYFLPLAGSLASRIALYEAGAEARYIEVP